MEIINDGRREACKVWKTRQKGVTAQGGRQKREREGGRGDKSYGQMGATPGQSTSSSISGSPRLVRSHRTTSPTHSTLVSKQGARQEGCNSSGQAVDLADRF